MSGNSKIQNDDDISVEFIRTGINSAKAITTDEGRKYETDVFVLTNEQAKQIQVIRDQVAIELSKKLKMI